VNRSAGGIRIFKDSDLEWLSLVICLKDTGMSVKQIKTFIGWYMDGDKTLKQRYETFIRQRQKTEQQIALLNKHLEKINYKIQYYKAALDAGTEKIHTEKLCLKENIRN
jgi:DNA-binding transcriptional MerR regulator